MKKESTQKVSPQNLAKFEKIRIPINTLKERKQTSDNTSIWK
uniref:Uncharacterized protein n=1 Tax=Chondria sp. (in: red algae) TaxID=1982705 RepID=A0A1Z1MQ78_9FLOR|nr:hypothetical protein [Chondria sp. (in: red algae)]